MKPSAQSRVNCIRQNGPSQWPQLLAGHQPQTALDKVFTVSTKTETQSCPLKISFKDLLSGRGLLPT